MKGRNKKFISIVTAAALTVTLLLNNSYVSSDAKEVLQSDLKETILNQMRNYIIRRRCCY